MQDLWSKYIQIRQLTNVTVCTIPLRKGCVPPIIKRQCCPHIETSQLICIGNQLTGFYIRTTLAFNGLIWSIKPFRTITLCICVHFLKENYSFHFYLLFLLALKISLLELFIFNSPISYIYLIF